MNKDPNRKPACIFYHTQTYIKAESGIRMEATGRCVLREVENGSIEKFDIYGGWNDNRAMEFKNELHGCPFIRRESDNQHTIEQVRKRCEGCSKRIKWVKQHQQEVEAQRLESRGF